MDIRPATHQDAQLLYKWRVESEEETPWWNGTPITWETHLQWLTPRIDSPLVHIWILQEEGQPVGEMRLDSNGEATIELVEEKRGQGLGAQALQWLCEQAVSLGHSRVKASIDDQNTPSIRAFEKAGFEYRDDVVFYLWRP